MMRLVESVELPAAADDVHAVVADLSRYPEWLSIVPRADREEAADAWRVDLRARVGPLSRAKRLRMVRTVDEAPRHVRFERDEQDGREHAAWVLDATVEPSVRGDGSVLVMELVYDGNLWVPMLDRLLRQEIERSKPRLVDLLTG